MDRLELVKTKIPCPRCGCLEAVIEDNGRGWWLFEASIQCVDCGLGKNYYREKSSYTKDSLVRRLNAEYFDYARDNAPHDFSLKITGKP